MGFPPQFFTVLFAIPRIAGYLAHWRETLVDPDTKIVRPQQDYRVRAGQDAGRERAVCCCVGWAGLVCGGRASLSHEKMAPPHRPITLPTSPPSLQGEWLRGYQPMAQRPQVVDPSAGAHWQFWLHGPLQPCFGCVHKHARSLPHKPCASPMQTSWAPCRPPTRTCAGSAARTGSEAGSRHAAGGAAQFCHCM